MHGSDTKIDPGRRRFRRRPSGAAAGGGNESLLALQAELTLLREENARLQAAQYEQPGPGAVIGRLRAMPDPGDGSDDGDEAAALLVEGLVVRDSLLQVCEELGTALAGIERRLRALEAEPEDPRYAADAA